MIERLANVDWDGIHRITLGILNVVALTAVGLIVLALVAAVIYGILRLVFGKRGDYD